jgi:hypothetical protein
MALCEENRPKIVCSASKTRKNGWLLPTAEIFVQTSVTGEKLS